MLDTFFMKKCYILHNALCFPWCNLEVVFYNQNQLPIAPTISATQFHIPKKRLVFSSASEMSHWLSGPSKGAPPGEREEPSRETFCSIKINNMIFIFLLSFLQTQMQFSYLYSLQNMVHVVLISLQNVHLQRKKPIDQKNQCTYRDIFNPCNFSPFYTCKQVTFCPVLNLPRHSCV